MARVEGADKVRKALQERMQQAGRSPSVIVGFTQGYALKVHEDLEAFHRVGKAKFLTDPLHEMQADLARQIKDDCKNGMDLSMALLRAGLRLQRASQLETPVDTGALRASAFTRLDEGA